MIDIAAVIARVRRAEYTHLYVGFDPALVIRVSDRLALLAHIDAQAARIAELERELDDVMADRDGLKAVVVKFTHGMAYADVLLSERAQSAARIAALEGALEPFVRAGALILAEIERLDRAAVKETPDAE